MENEIKTQELTSREIKEGLLLFYRCIKRGLFTYDHANPIIENCYTSSSYIVGVYFPNTQFIEHPHKSFYKVCSVSKVNNELGVMFSIIDEDFKHKEAFNTYQFETFDSLLHSKTYLLIRDKITRRINDYKKRLKAIDNIRVINKKDGQDFKRLFDNFEGARFYYKPYLSYNYHGVITNIYIYSNGEEITLYRSNESQEITREPTKAEIIELLHEKRQELTNWIDTEEKELKELEKNVVKFEKLASQLKTFYYSVSNSYDYKKELEYLVI